MLYMSCCFVNFNGIVEWVDCGSRAPPLVVVCTCSLFAHALVMVFVLFVVRTCSSCALHVVGTCSLFARSLVMVFTRSGCSVCGPHVLELCFARGWHLAELGANNRSAP